jgi:hypothetical protein
LKVLERRFHAPFFLPRSSGDFAKITAWLAFRVFMFGTVGDRTSYASSKMKSNGMTSHRLADLNPFPLHLSGVAIWWPSYVRVAKQPWRGEWLELFKAKGFLTSVLCHLTSIF